MAVTTSNYLLDLSVKLAEGLSRLPAETRKRHAGFLLRWQNADGGFPGREGGSDLYYTAFALRGLAILDSLTPHLCERAAGYLKENFARQTGVVDFFSLLFSCLMVRLGGGPDVLAHSPEDWPERVAAELDLFRAPDGGYAKTQGNKSSSTYHTFLVVLCHQLLGKPTPGPEGVIRFLRSRHREDGGFVEIAPMKRSGTNPTAAAVGALQILGSVNPEAALVLEEITPAVGRFLLPMISEEGGFQANGRAPLADLLSTFTGLWTLNQLQVNLESTQLDSLRDYVKGVELQEGGFRGGLWDAGTDVEYTFYGLGCLALL